jgi:hypothetical protein
MEFDPTGLYHGGPRYYNPDAAHYQRGPERGKDNLFDYTAYNPVSGCDLRGMDDCLGDRPDPPIIGNWWGAGGWERRPMA